MAGFRDLPRSSLRQRATTLDPKGGRKAAIVAMDVTDAKSVRAAAAQVGDARIDLLLNCAGITGVSGQKVGKVNYDSWARVLDVNTMGPLRVIPRCGTCRRPKSFKLNYR